MSPAASSTVHPEPIVTDLPVWRFTVDQYRRMLESGTLTDDDAVELLEGLVVPKMPKNPPHILVCKLLRRYLERLLGDGWHVATQDPIATDDSEPEPDLAVLRGDEEDYANRLPTRDDCPLVIEVADTTLSRDRGIKRRIYARAGISQYWIVSIADQTVEVFTEPTGAMDLPAYGHAAQYVTGEAVPLILNGSQFGEVTINSIFPTRDAT